MLFIGNETAISTVSHRQGAVSPPRLQEEETSQHFLCQYETLWIAPSLLRACAFEVGNVNGSTIISVFWAYAQPKLTFHMNKLSLFDLVTTNRSLQLKTGQATSWREKVQVADNVRNALTKAKHHEGDEWSKARGPWGWKQASWGAGWLRCRTGAPEMLLPLFLLRTSGWGLGSKWFNENLGLWGLYKRNENSTNGPISRNTPHSWLKRMNHVNIVMPPGVISRF